MKSWQVNKIIKLLLAGELWGVDVAQPESADEGDQEQHGPGRRKAERKPSNKKIQIILAKQKTKKQMRQEDLNLVLLIT